VEARRTSSEKRKEIFLRGLHRQISIAGDFSNLLVEENVLESVNPRVAMTFPLNLSVIESANALLHLLEHSPPFITPAYMLARGLVESTVNYCFLLQCSEDDFNNWVSYSRQKAYRRLDRTQEAGNKKLRLHFDAKFDPAEIPGLSEDLAKFTGPKGGERNRWTQKSINDRLAEIGQHSPDDEKLVLTLLVALAATYEIGSEALHGTLIGAGFAYGLFGLPNETPSGQAVLLLMAATECVAAMVQVGARKAAFANISEASRTSLTATLMLIEKSLAHSGTPNEDDASSADERKRGWHSTIDGRPTD